MIFQFLVMFTIIGFELESDFTIIENDELVETINRDDYLIPYIDEPFINQSKIKDLLNHLKKEIYLEPVDAKLNDQGDIIKEKLGHKIDERQFLNNFYESVYDRQIRGFRLPKESIHPKVDSEMLSEIKQVKIGEFFTYFQTSNKERVHNIELATEAINNYVLFPGEIFSFNKVLGQRTVEKGYKKAPVIVKGELSEDIGGGICQVSSTLYNAIDIKGVKVLERYSHSRSVPYVPPGRDAAVSWQGPDLVFQNELNRPLLIRAKSASGKMLVHIYSSEEISD